LDDDPLKRTSFEDMGRSLSRDSPATYRNLKFQFIDKYEEEESEEIMKSDSEYLYSRSSTRAEGTSAGVDYSFDALMNERPW
jgi:hypothetical protein